MRNFRVRFQIDIFAIEHHPFSIRRWHRRADELELHHVFEGEWMFATGDTGPWCLREKRSCEPETECDKNFHLAGKLPPNLRTCNGLPGQRTTRRELIVRSIYARNASRAISKRKVSTRSNCSCARFSSSPKSIPCSAAKFGVIAANERQRSRLPVIPKANASSA